MVQEVTIQHFDSDLGGSAMAACQRPGCPFTRKASAGHRDHGFCCNACRHAEGRHTKHCTGYFHHSLTLGTPRPTQTDRPAFKIPEEWGCTTGGIVEYIDWLTGNLLGHQMDIETKCAWSKMEEQMSFIRRGRQLTIHVLAEDSASPLLMNTKACAFINVNALGVKAYAPLLYDQKQVTGINFVVQAVLSSQRVTAEILLHACRLIETGLETFAFVCTHATHRSCGCAVLLASLVYRDARIVFSTDRTVRAATEVMIEEQIENGVGTRSS